MTQEKHTEEPLRIEDEAVLNRIKNDKLFSEFVDSAKELLVHIKISRDTLKMFGVSDDALSVMSEVITRAEKVFGDGE